MNRVGKERRNNLNKHQLKNDENKFKKKNKIKSKKFKRIKIVLIILLILIVFTAIKTGIFIANWQSLAQDMISNTPSQVLDIQGNVIAEFGTNKNTKNVSFNEMPDNLKNAYVAIEDQRFYKHSGVDFPRTAAAIFSYIRNLGSSSFGGSTITQQLVKNLTGDNSSKVSRKINEWIKAFAIEGVLDKDEILEAYLNIIYVGPNLYGVEMGSNYYFNKSVSELDLAECAFLAGINNSPNSYNPFDDENVTYVINSNVAFCKENKYAIVLTSNHKYVLKKAYCFNEPELIQDVVITEDENFAFVIYWGNLFVIDLKKDYCIESIPLIGTNNAIVNGNSIFYVNIHKNMPIISQVSVNSGGELEENRFKYTDESLAPKYFGVALGRKFVIVHPSSNYKDVIYCNSEKFCDIDCKHSNTKYNVIYDAFSKTWLVINEEGYIVIIKQDGTFDKFKLNDEIEVLVKNIRYVKGNIYIPNDGCLWIISVKDQFKCKKMECHKIMTSASRICKVDRNGFTVVTDGKLYVIRRG